MKEYTFWDYIKMIMSVALIFTLGVLWSDFLTNLGNRILNTINNWVWKEILAIILILVMTLLVIVLIVYVFGYQGEEMIGIIQSGM